MTRTEELLKEFIEKYKTTWYPKEGNVFDKRDNADKMASDLNALLDKLMLTDAEILEKFNNDMGYCHTRTLQTRWQGVMWLLEWFRSRMKGSEK